jgi:hypothetical protein
MILAIYYIGCLVSMCSHRDLRKQPRNKVWSPLRWSAISWHLVAIANTMFSLHHSGSASGTRFSFAALPTRDSSPEFNTRPVISKTPVSESESKYHSTKPLPPPTPTLTPKGNDPKSITEGIESYLRRDGAGNQYGQKES